MIKDMKFYFYFIILFTTILIFITCSPQIVDTQAKVKIFNYSDYQVDINVHYEQIYYVKNDVDYYKRSYDHDAGYGYSSGYSDGYSDGKSWFSFNKETFDASDDLTYINNYEDGYDDGYYDGSDEKNTNNDYHQEVRSIEENFTVNTNDKAKFLILWESKKDSIIQDLKTKCKMNIVCTNNEDASMSFDRTHEISTDEQLEVYILNENF
jgi:hypothetical protein